MEKEISSGTMLGIVLIALAAIIGLGFGIFSIAKGVANEGTVGVQDNLGTVSESAFDDYNDKIVTGTMVKSAVTNFSGKSVGILINTTAMDKGVKPYATHESLAVISMTNNAITTYQPSIVEGKAANILKSTETGGKAAANTHYYVNYNAILGTKNVVAGTEEVNLKTAFSGIGNLKLKDGIYIAESIPFAVNNVTGKVLFDTSVGGFSRTGNCEYLAPTAKFDANLIKDETGTTIGIVFTQRVQ